MVRRPTRLVLLLAALALVGVLTAACRPITVGGGTGGNGRGPKVTINQIQVLASHNSYHVEPEPALLTALRSVIGAATDGFGGGNGFAVGKDAPPEAVQFLEYITGLDQAIRAGEAGQVLPVTKGAEVSITDPLQQEVLAGLSEASFVQLYLDQFFSPELGAAVNDAVATLFAGTATPEEVTEAITAAAS